MDRATEYFLESVREYCSWAESEPKTETEEVKVAIRLLADLYSGVLVLSNNGPGNNVVAKSITKEEWNKIYIRFGALPFNYYHEFFSPYKLVEEDPVIGDLADDLADIYRDVKNGLLLYEQGHVTEALWRWSQSFSLHWGRHATSALHALHAYAADEDIEP